MIFQCVWCGDGIFSLSYFCPECSDLRRAFLLSNRKRFLNLVKNNLTELVGEPPKVPYPTPKEEAKTTESMKASYSTIVNKKELEKLIKEA